MRKKDLHQTHITTGPEETQQIGEQLASILQTGDILLMSGDLGSGKTCFVQGIAKGFGIQEHINSPTYTYLHPYQTKDFILYHIDLYRVDEKEKLDAIGVTEIVFDRDNILAIEWPEILQDSFSVLKNRRIIHINFHHKDAHNREIDIRIVS